MLLRGKDVTKYFGGIAAVNKVDFYIDKGEIVALIGPNGAGKTTLFNLINGMMSLSGGRILLDEADITGMKPFMIQKMGVSRTFQLVRPFMEMTALENVVVGLLFGNDEKIGINKAKTEALTYLEIVNMLHRRETKAKELTSAERKFVELALALATKPKIILLDEFIAGMNPTEILWAMGLIRKIRDEFNISLFWVEHVMKAVMEVSDRIIVLNYGEKIAEGTPSEIARSQKVIEAYLGSTKNIGKVEPKGA